MVPLKRLMVFRMRLALDAWHPSVHDKERRGDLLNSVVFLFSDCVSVIAPESSFGPILEYLDSDIGFRTFAGEFLSSIDTGIGDLTVEQNKISADKLPKQLVESLQSLRDNGRPGACNLVSIGQADGIFV